MEERSRRDGRHGGGRNAATRVAVQERRSLLRSGIRLLLDNEDDLAVVGAAETDEDLRAIVGARPVDVVVLEVRVEDWDVARLADDLRQASSDLLVIGLHSGRRSDHANLARAAGIQLLLPYSAGGSTLVAALRGVEPHPASDPPVERRVLPGREVLTVREQEVLRHISAGLTTQQSAQLLDVSPKTIDNHKQRMFAKLGVQNQAHAVAVAHRAGILRSLHRKASGD